MKKTYLIGSLLLAGATSLSASAQNVVTLKAADYGVEGSGVVVDGVTEDGSSQVRPLKSVSFEGVTMSFDQNGEDNSEPAYFTAPAYSIRAYSNNTITISAPAGRFLNEVEFTLMDDYYNYGMVTSDKGVVVCNGGDTEVAYADKKPAKKYSWMASNPMGEASVTLTLAAKCFDGTMSNQLRVSQADFVLGPELNQENLFGEATPNLAEEGPVDMEVAPSGMQMVQYVFQLGMEKNPKCNQPITLSYEGQTIAWVYAADTTDTPPFATVMGFDFAKKVKRAAAEGDDDFGGFEGDDNFGVDAEDQDPEFGGSEGDDNFGVDGGDQDPEFGGHDGDDNFGVDGGDQDPEFGGFGDDNFGVDPENPGDEMGVNPMNPSVVQIVFAEDPITQPGKYTVNIPQGFFTINGAEVLAMEFDYEIEGEVPVTPSYDGQINDYILEVSPMDGSVNNRLTLPSGMSEMGFFLGSEEPFSVNKDCAETVKLYHNGNVISEIAVSADAAELEEFEPCYMVENMLDEEDNYEGAAMVMFIFFEDDYTEPGDYAVVIPNGFFQMGENGEYKIAGGSLSFRYIDGDSAGTFASLVSEATPEIGSSVNIQDDQWKDGLSWVNYMVDGGDVQAAYDCDEPIKLMRGDEVVVEVPVSNTFADGAYVEVYSTSFFSNEAAGSDDEFGGFEGDDDFGVTSDEQDPEFGGHGDDDFGVTSDEPDPEFGGHGGDDDFGVTSDEQDPEFGGHGGDDDFGVTGDDQDPEFGGHGDDSGFGVDPNDPSFGGNDDDPAFTLPGYQPKSFSVNIFFADTFGGVDPITGVGEYTVVIPDGYFMDGELPIEGSSFNYTVVDDANVAVDLFKADGTVTVYNVNGMRLLNNAPVESLKELNRGIYVINGRKVVIK